VLNRLSAANAEIHRAVGAWPREPSPDGPLRGNDDRGAGVMPMSSVRRLVLGARAQVDLQCTSQHGLVPDRVPSREVNSHLLFAFQGRHFRPPSPALRKRDDVRAYLQRRLQLDRYPGRLNREARGRHRRKPGRRKDPVGSVLRRLSCDGARDRPSPVDDRRRERSTRKYYRKRKRDFAHQR
jgi:hypothetical protein